LRLFSFGGYGLALAALALVVFGAYDSYPLVFLELKEGSQEFPADKESTGHVTLLITTVAPKRR